MEIQIPDNNVNEIICYLESSIAMLYKYEQLSNNFVMCECATIQDIINKLKG